MSDRSDDIGATGAADLAQLAADPDQSAIPGADLAHERIQRRPVLGALINENERAA
jgi:hypothetical protein